MRLLWCSGSDDEVEDMAMDSGETREKKKGVE
jgi:hypothetical protein